jgi:hypothetical protein
MPIWTIVDNLFFSYCVHKSVYAGFFFSFICHTEKFFYKRNLRISSSFCLTIKKSNCLFIWHGVSKRFHLLIALFYSMWFLKCRVLKSVQDYFSLYYFSVTFCLQKIKQHITSSRFTRYLSLYIIIRTCRQGC